MNHFLRRVRGALGLGAFAGITWTLVGAAIGFGVLILDPASIDPGESVGQLTSYFGRASVFVVLGSLTIVGALALANRGEQRASLRDADTAREISAPAH